MEKKKIEKIKWKHSIFPYLKIQKWSLILLVGLKLLASLITIIHPLLFSWIINDLLNTDHNRMWRFISIFLFLQALSMLINYFIRAVDLRIAKAMNLDVKA